MTEITRAPAQASRRGAREKAAAGDAGRPSGPRRPQQAAAEPAEAASRPPAPVRSAHPCPPARAQPGRQGRPGRRRADRADPAVAAWPSPSGVGAVVAAPPAAAGVPVGAGPGGHTQRLLTVVKSGSIQEVKASPVDKVHTWPHLLVAEFVASLACLAFTFVFSIFVNAPLLQEANFNQTPNPSKAPWYFLGLQELLTMFHPMVAGVTIPGVGLIILIFAPYIDKNPSNKPEDRKFAASLMTVHLMFWAVLVIIGSFFRGPGLQLHPAVDRRAVLRAVTGP